MSDNLLNKNQISAMLDLTQFSDESYVCKFKNLNDILTDFMQTQTHFITSFVDYSTVCGRPK